MIEEQDGFLKEVCHGYWCRDSRYCYSTYNKCHNSDQIYVVVERWHPFDGPKYSLHGEICDEDPHFYQACDTRLGVKITNNELLCEYYWCKSGIMNSLPPALSSMGLICNGRFDCPNTQLDEKGCSEGKVDLKPGSQSARQENIICDDKCDLWMTGCTDEAVCNGYRYGMFCERDGAKIGYGFVTPYQICDGVLDCKDKEDETICEVTGTTKDTCQHALNHRIVPVHNFTRCQLTEIPGFAKRWKYCKSPISDQTNCTDPSRIAVRCEVNGYPSTVSKYMLCQQKEQICDDNMENLCLTLSKSCHVHKHHMCDKTNHCEDKAGENHEICVFCRTEFSTETAITM